MFCREVFFQICFPCWACIEHPDFGVLQMFSNATIDCPYGYSGTRSISCDSHAFFPEVPMLHEEVNNCERLICHEVNGFWGLVYPEMLSLEETLLSCLPGYSGTVTLNCMVDPVMGAVHRASGGCTAVYCPEDGVWPRTGGGRSVTRNCNGINGDSGVQMRRWLPK